VGFGAFQHIQLDEFWGTSQSKILSCHPKTSFTKLFWSQGSRCLMPAHYTSPAHYRYRYSHKAYHMFMIKSV